MEIISIEKKTFEELVSRLGQFVKRMDSINRQRSGRRMSDWMDNQDVKDKPSHITDLAG